MHQKRKFVIVSICVCVHVCIRTRERQRQRERDRERERQRGRDGRDGRTDRWTDESERTLVITIQLYKLLLWIKVPGKCTVCRGYSS